MYKADTPKVDSILANDITISFVCHSFPHKLIKHLKQIRNYSIEKQEDGVYYVKGDFFPIQIMEDKLYSSVTEIIIQANEEKFEVVDIVYDSLKRIILEQNREAYEKEKIIKKKRLRYNFNLRRFSCL